MCHTVLISLVLEFMKWTGGEFPVIIPTVVRRVGHEDEEPQVIVIEPEQQQQVASGKLQLGWKSVAHPYLRELEPIVSLDRFWHTIRFVGPETRPYVTIATSFNENSVCFPMTFFIDTGSPINFIKRSAFDFINATEKRDTGQKVLYIGGNRFLFSKPSVDSTHNNINLLGTDALSKLLFLFQSLPQGYKDLCDNKIVVEEGRGSIPSDWK